MSRHSLGDDLMLELERLREEITHLRDREWYIRLSDANQRLREEIAELQRKLAR